MLRPSNCYCIVGLDWPLGVVCVVSVEGLRRLRGRRWRNFVVTERLLEFSEGPPHVPLLLLLLLTRRITPRSYVVTGVSWFLGTGDSAAELYLFIHFMLTRGCVLCAGVQ